MDPQLKSILTSLLMTLTTGAATWLASKGLIATGDESVFATWLMSGILYAVTALIFWYKQRQQTQTALIQAVNHADNGVKVVPATAPVDAVNQPLKGPGA